MKFIKIIIVCSAFFYQLVYPCELQRDPKKLLEEYIQNRTNYVDSRYRPQYHVTPPVGWLKEPSGLVYYKELYHLFYQFYPYEGDLGSMYWGHVTSKDLVKWDQSTTALLPENGIQCLSGSAVDMNGILVLIYTGDNGNNSSPNKETQHLAYSDGGTEFSRYLGNPVLHPPSDQPEFRSPKVWRYQDNWYVVIGSKSDASLGNVLLYKSSDLVSWEFQSVLASSNDAEREGSMWESPDFFELNGKYVLLISPRGIKATTDKYKNLYQTGTIIGSFDYTTSGFKREINCFEELDYGHDFYAAQTVLVDGTRILIAWLGMPDTNYTEDVDGWSGVMTIPRELTLVDNRVLMMPAKSISALRNETVYNETLVQNERILSLQKSAELIITIPDLDQDVKLTFGGNRGGTEVTLTWNAITGYVVLDRGGDTREAGWDYTSNKSWRIFLDTSSMELFCGDGEVVFSSRVFPNGNWIVKNEGQQAVKVVVYQLKKSVPW